MAVNFYNILRANGYKGFFNFGNASAWERDFKEPDDQTYVDAADIVMHADHGGHCGFAFGNTSHDDCILWASEAKWGNQDLEWIILDDCSVLQRTFGWTCWEGAFQVISEFFTTHGQHVPLKDNIMREFHVLTLSCGISPLDEKIKGK